MDSKELSQLILKRHIQDVDLSKIDLNGYDFSECVLKNVKFVSKDQQDRELKNINFKDAQLEYVLFDNAIIENCNFDVTNPDDDKTKIDYNPSINKVSFRKCKLINCRFRNAKFFWSDFRYSEIKHATFENSEIEFCDFYRAFFHGIIIFKKSKISNSSLHYTYFNSTIIRKENILNGKILQQDYENYEKFLNEWHYNGPGVRQNDQGDKSSWSPEDSLEARFTDAEDIYKSLNGLWVSKGFLYDANWAYVQGRKMERKRLKAELKSDKIPVCLKLRKLPFFIWNKFCDIFFGYGESIIKMIGTYILIVIVCACLFYVNISLESFFDAIEFSFKNMIAMTPEEIKNVSFFVDVLNVIQTTVGILMTGIFGFILGNKIRNQ